MKKYYTYIVTDKPNGKLYTGMTNDLLGRVRQHKEKKDPTSYTARFNLDKLVWYQSFDSPLEAIRREKEIKGWLRIKKIRLIEESNPEWRDLYPDVRQNQINRFGKMSDDWRPPEGDSE